MRKRVNKQLCEYAKKYGNYLLIKILTKQNYPRLLETVNQQLQYRQKIKRLY